MNIERDDSIVGKVLFDYDHERERVYIHLEKAAEPTLSTIKFVTGYINQLASIWRPLYAIVSDTDMQMVKLLTFVGFERTDEQIDKQNVWLLNPEEN